MNLAPMAPHIRSTSDQAQSQILPLATKSLRWSGSVALLDLVVQEFQACLLWPLAPPEFGQADPGPVGVPIVQPEPLADDFLGGQRSVA